jgi:hypothetical protein
MLQTELRKNRNLFPDELWTPLAIFALPVFIFENGKPVLTPAELVVYSLGCEVAENPKHNCCFALSLTDLQQLTGFSDRKHIIEALDGLVAKSFIRPVGTRRRGSKTPQAYELMNPLTEDGFSTDSQDKRERQNFRSALYHRSLGYFNVPIFALRALPEFGARAIVLFVAMARCANTTEAKLRRFNTRQLVEGAYSSRDFEMPAMELRTMTGLDPKTFKNVMTRIHGQLLHVGFTTSTSRTVQVILIDPVSKDSLDLLLNRQREADEAAQRKRWAENRGQNRKHTAAQLLAWAMWFFKDASPQPASGSDFMFWCPVCHNKKTRKGKNSQKQRFGVNPFKGAHGLCYCQDCGHGGSVWKLVTSSIGLFEAGQKLARIEDEEPKYFQSAQELVRGFTEDGERKRIE